VSENAPQSHRRPTSTIRLIICDIDGTLLDRYGDLPPGNAEALAEALGRGVRLVLATVRKRDAAEMIARRVGLACTLVCQGGATIYDEHGELLRATAIPIELARAIAALADEQRLPLLTTIDELNYYMPGSHPPAHIDTAGVDVSSSLAILSQPPTRFIVRGELGVNLLMKTFAAAPLRMMRHYRDDGTLYDAAITHADATKEAALDFLCRRWEIAPAAVLAIGDAEADIGMIRMAGVGVSVGNGHPLVKDAADWIAPSAGDAGVAAAVRRFVLNDAIREA